MTVDILAGFLGVVGSVLFEGVVDDGIVDAVFVFSFNQDGLDVEFFPDEVRGLTLFRAFRSDTEGLFLRFKK